MIQEGEPEARRRALDLVRRARSLARLLLAREGLALPPEADLSILLPVALAADRDEGAAARLLAGLRHALKAAAPPPDLPEGRAFCHRCGSGRCPHSRPGDPREVFAGYDPTGRPRWLDLVSWCLERKDGRVDLALAAAGPALTAVEAGADLGRERLPVFGGENPPYRILAQVVAGLFSLRAAGGEEVRSAATIQVVRRAGGGRPRLELMLLVHDPEAWRRDPSLMEILAEARHSLDLLGLRLAGLEGGGGDGPGGELILSFLRRLARDLEHHSQGLRRRTGHALARARQAVRPTEMAYPDARAAGDQELLVDTVEETVVVLGPRGRVHIFTPDGRHITSLRLRGDAIRRRRQTGRWRPAEAAERGAFRSRLRGQAGLTDPGRG